MKDSVNIKIIIKIVKILIIILIILFLFFIGIFGGSFLYVFNKAEKINKVSINEENIEITEGIEEKLTRYTNVALFGIDSREDTYSLGNRSDCIIIASINNDTREVRLVSVYRDTYLNITNRGLDKVTHAYSFGGPELSMSTLNTNLDLDIKQFVTVNFDAVVEMVNSVGGVEINIEQDEITYLNNYIRATSQNTGIESKEVMQTGIQTLDGVQAVAYSRIRYTEGGDYKRAERMRTVLTAIINKAKTKSITELNSLLDTILPKIYTNIDSKDIVALLPQIMGYNVVESTGWPYEIRGITLDRWYGVPITLEGSVSKLHKALFDKENYIPSNTVQEISNQIIIKTGYR